MNRKQSVAGVALLSLAVGAGVAASAGGAADESASTIKLVIRQGTYAAVDVRTKKYGPGDYYVEHNTVLDAARRSHVGHTLVQCVVVARKTEQCLSTWQLKGGTITAQAGFPSSGGFVLAITGGTGAYQAARGQIVGGKPKGKDFPVTINLVP